MRTIEPKTTDAQEGKAPEKLVFPNIVYCLRLGLVIQADCPPASHHQASKHLEVNSSGTLIRGKPQHEGSSVKCTTVGPVLKRKTLFGTN